MCFLWIHQRDEPSLTLFETEAYLYFFWIFIAITDSRLGLRSHYSLNHRQNLIPNRPAKILLLLLILVWKNSYSNISLKTNVPNKRKNHLLRHMKNGHVRIYSVFFYCRKKSEKNDFHQKGVEFLNSCSPTHLGGKCHWQVTYKRLVLGWFFSNNGVTETIV